MHVTDKFKKKCRHHLKGKKNLLKTFKHRENSKQN